MNIHAAYAPFLRHFRRRRMQEFLRLFPITPRTTILDVGGHFATWTSLASRVNVTLLNLSAERVGSTDYRFVVGDAREMPFKDHAFDIVFSNSVIEHLGGWEEQQRFAREIMRVGRYYYVQTPNRWFFMEPHLLTPFIHFLPRSLQRLMLRNCSVWGLIARPTRRQCDEFLKEVRLLTRTEMAALFADGVILRERVAGMVKSIIAVRLPPQPLPTKVAAPGANIAPAPAKQEGTALRRASR